MKVIYNNSSIPEREAKLRYHFPENIMMENAAASMHKLITEVCSEMSSLKESKVLIVCGSGNNGGDGYALARRLYGSVKLSVISVEAPRTFEAMHQIKMAQAVGVDITQAGSSSLLRLTDMIVSGANVIVDCVFGSGFHGQMPENTEKLIKLLNASSAIRVACDIPSGIDINGNCASTVFKADYTVTMGALKSALYSDSAKDYTGKISVADLGISPSSFEKCAAPDMFLIEPDDVRLPLRKKRSSHKGSYGHTVVIAGEKSGAAIMSAEASMNFGSGLTTILKTTGSNLEQFKISPELMISDKLPQKTSSIVIGPGLGIFTSDLCNNITAWFSAAKKPSCVIDADMFSYENLAAFLTQLNSVEDARIVLTPHLKELQRLLENLTIDSPEELVKQFPNVVLVAKSAVTKIYTAEKTYVCADGAQSLSKGGSGDLLAGMIGALLSQGYTSVDAAITGVECHALASRNYGCGEEDYSLKPLSLLPLLSASL